MDDDTFIVHGPPPLEPIPNTSVGQLFYDALAKCNDDVALIDAHTDRSFSYRELFSRTSLVAESLRNSGYNENTMISICSENSIDFFTPIIAAFYVGATVAPINFTYTKAELIHALNIVHPQIIFCSTLMYPKIAELRKELKYIEKVIILNDDGAVAEETLDSFISQNARRNLSKFEVANMDIEKETLILFSSGTTGLPKGVMITQKNILVKMLHSRDPRLIYEDSEKSVLGFLPFFHAYGLFVSLDAILRQIKTVVMKKFDEQLFYSCIEKYRISSLTLVPPLAVLITKSSLVKKYDLSSVKYVGCGAAPLSKATEELLIKRLKNAKMRQGYGLTEATLTVTATFTNDYKIGSTGKLYPFLLCKIRDPITGKSLEHNRVGEICIKGPSVMKGYYRDTKATENAFTKDGWLLTGDLGYYDENEYFYIVGRLKELIKYKGFQVPPAELEAILLKYSKIKDAAVVGLPDEEAGELPLAFIVKADESLTEADVQKYVEDRVSSPKKLRGGVIFVTEIPKNPSGKILRQKLHKILKSFVKSKL